MIRLTALLLVMAFVVFLIGAGFWLVGEFERPLEERLRAIAVHQRRWQWIHAWMFAGTVVSVVAVGALARLLRDDGSGALATWALVLFGVGGLAFLVSLIVGLTKTPMAAIALSQTGGVPPDYLPWHRAAGALYVGYMLLSYAAFSLLGAAILGSSILPVWLGWFGVISGAVAFVGFALLGGGPFAPPILAHTFGLLVGIVLFVKSWSE